MSERQTVQTRYARGEGREGRDQREGERERGEKGVVQLPFPAHALRASLREARLTSGSWLSKSGTSTPNSEYHTFTAAVAASVDAIRRPKNGGFEKGDPQKGHC